MYTSTTVDHNVFVMHLHVYEKSSHCTCQLVASSIYCKRGYFRWGEISQKGWQDISRGDNFHDNSPISFIKAYGFYFRVGVIFAKKTKEQKTSKLPPRENFHVYINMYKYL